MPSVPCVRVPDISIGDESTTIALNLIIVNNNKSKHLLWAWYLLRTLLSQGSANYGLWVTSLLFLEFYWCATLFTYLSMDCCLPQDGAEPLWLRLNNQQNINFSWSLWENEVKHMSELLQVRAQLILMMVLWGSYFYYPHFAHWEIKSEILHICPVICCGKQQDLRLITDTLFLSFFSSTFSLSCAPKKYSEDSWIFWKVGIKMWGVPVTCFLGIWQVPLLLSLQSLRRPHLWYFKRNKLTF